MKHTPNLEIMEFVEREILPRYASFDPAHQLSHVSAVIKNALMLAKSTGTDIDMCYVIAAYHDLGLEGPRAVHHLTGGKILAGDARLRRWFSAEQIKTMKEAVEDHRASASRAPRSIYGKIVAEADRNIDREEVCRRTFQYGLNHFPDLSDEEQYLRFKEHLNSKYGPNGYMKLWIHPSPNDQPLRELRALIENEDELRQMFEKLRTENGE